MVWTAGVALTFVERGRGVMKHRCPDFKGWFTDGCPQADFVLPAGQVFTTDQLAWISTGMVLVSVIVGALLIGLLMTMLMDAVGD